MIMMIFFSLGRYQTKGSVCLEKNQKRNIVHQWVSFHYSKFRMPNGSLLFDKNDELLNV